MGDGEGVEGVESDADKDDNEDSEEGDDSAGREGARLGWRKASAFAFAKDDCERRDGAGKIGISAKMSKSSSSFSSLL